MRASINFLLLNMLIIKVIAFMRFRVRVGVDKALLYCCHVASNAPFTFPADGTRYSLKTSTAESGRRIRIHDVPLWKSATFPMPAVDQRYDRNIRCHEQYNHTKLLLSKKDLLNLVRLSIRLLRAVSARLVLQQPAPAVRQSNSTWRRRWQGERLKL